MATEGTGVCGRGLTAIRKLHYRDLDRAARRTASARFEEWPFGPSGILRVAMSQADIEAIRARYEAVSAETGRPSYRDVAPGFTLKTPDRVPNAGTYLGAEEATRFMEDFWEPFEEVIVEPQEFLENGDQIVVDPAGAQHGTRESSAFLEIRVAALWTMRDGKPIRCEMFPQRRGGARSRRTDTRRRMTDEAHACWDHRTGRSWGFRTPSPTAS